MVMQHECQWRVLSNSNSNRISVSELEAKELGFHCHRKPKLNPLHLLLLPLCFFPRLSCPPPSPSDDKLPL